MTRWFHDLAIARKMLLSFGLVVLVMCGTLAADTIASRRQATLTDRITQHLDPAEVTALDIVTLVRSIDDDGAWMVNSLSGNRAHTAALSVTYYQEVATLHATVQQALALADTERQRQVIRQFIASYWGTKPITAADRKTLDGQSHWVFGGADGYLFGNEQVFAKDRAGHYLQAAFAYTTVPFIGALHSAQVYLDIVQQEIGQASAQEQDAAQLVLGLSFGLGAFALLFSMGMVLLITRVVGGSLQRLRTAAQRLARGDTAIEDALPPATGDELGALSASFRSMVTYQQTMAGAAQAMAQGDLTTPITPQDDDDLLGHAFVSMQRKMRTLLADTAASAERVDAEARQLQQASTQIGDASTQIAKAIEDVARGAASQSRIANETIQSMDALIAVLDEVHGGAKSQQVAAGVARTALDELEQALARTARSAATMREAATHAAATARAGSAAVNQTLANVASAHAATLHCNNPYPCAFDRGLVTAVGARFKPADVAAVLVRHDDTQLCRAKGADSCTYRIQW
jgi:HAMP domain-containing protein